MKRIYLIAGAMMLGLLVQAAEGKHIARAVLQTRSGATVASAAADGNGRIRFTNVPPGEFRIVLTNPEGRSVTLSDLDGDGHGDIVVAGPPATMGSGGGGGGAGKVNVQDLSMTKSPAKGGSSSAAAPVVSPRDAASGLPTGKRQHQPFTCLVNWDGTVKGGFPSETVAQAEGANLPDNSGGMCAIKVVVDEQPGTIEVQSWSWGASKHTKTGHVTLMK